MEAPRAGGINTVAKKWGKHIFEQQFTLPNGTSADFLLLDTDAPPVIVLPLTDSFSVVALHHFRYGANDWIIEIPGGCVEHGQSFEETLINELREETGYQAHEIIDLSHGNHLWFEPAVNRTQFIPMLALGCKKVAEPSPEETEFIEVEEFTLADWVTKIRKGVIRDSKTITVTFLALLNHKLPVSF